MGSNRIVLILIFVAVGYFLFHRDKEGPLGDMVNSVKKVFSTESTEKENPYKAKERNDSPTSEVIDDISDKVASKAEDKIAGLFNDLKERISGTNKKEIVNNLPESYYPVASTKLEIVKHKAFVLGYSEEHEQAAWTLHELTRESTYGNASRDGLSFMPDGKISTSSALSSDYTRSGFDRGHLVPAGDFKCCQELLMDTFWVSNIVPQNPDCNRYIWNSLEQQVRNWAKRKKKLYVITGPVLKEGLRKIGKFNRISIPEALYKIIVYVDEANLSNTQVKAFLIPNVSGLGHRYNEYKTSVDAVESATGLDFLADLPDELEKDIEASISTARW